jgi:hypothetical protein
MVDFWSVAVSSGGLKILFWVFISIIVVILIAVGVWRFIRAKFIFRYRFGLVNHGGRIVIKKAKIHVNKYMVKKFMIDGYPDQLLDIREPNCLVDNLHTRLVAFDGMGNIVYCTGHNMEKSINSAVAKLNVGKKEYLETALLPMEREAVANNIVDATKKYGKMPQEVKWAFGFSFLLIIVVVIGLFVQGKMLVEQYKINSEDVGALLEAANVIKANTGLQTENLKIQQIILERVTEGERNITLVSK